MAWRVVFFGTAELAVSSLKALAGDSNYEVVAVVTQPDKPRGRDLLLQPSAVKAAALNLRLSVLQPTRARDSRFIDEIRQLRADLNVVAAYGQILPQALLDIPKHGSLNVHTSLLPRHRGAAPIQWAILSGDAETGVTIMKMDAGLDTGPILTQRKTPVLDSDTGQTLHNRLADIGAALLLETIPGWMEGRIPEQPQPDGSTYARKIEKADGLIDWDRPAVEIRRKLRAFTPWPGAFTFLESGGRRRMIKILEGRPIEGQANPGVIVSAAREGIDVGAGDSLFRILALQPEGKKRMTTQEFLAGNPVSPGQAFSR